MMPYNPHTPFNPYQLSFSEALQAHPNCRPNPAVGAVITHQGKVIGHGHTQSYGGDHAEIAAINSVQDKSLLPKAVLYVTLDPCTHYGKTPPCLDRIIKEGIREIHIGLPDPNPKVKKRFLSQCKKLELNILYDYPDKLKQNIFELNEGFFFTHTLGRPMVSLKLALTLDGKMATTTGDSKWITNKSSRATVHQLRDQADAILVGERTAICDNPQLTVRIKGRKRKNYLRVVLNPEKKIPSKNLLLADNHPTLIFVSQDKQLKHYPRKETVKLDFRKGSFDLDSVLDFLKMNKEVTHLFVEGGSKIAGHFLHHGLVDRVHFFYAPKILGDGKHALSPFETDMKVNNMQESLSLLEQKVDFHDNDIHVCGYLNKQWVKLKRNILK